MNKHIIFVGLFFLSTMPFSVSAATRKNAQRNVMQNATVQQFLSSSIGSLAMGVGVGAITGNVMGYLQNGIMQYFAIESSLVRLLLTAANVTLGSEISNNMIAAVENTLDNNQIAYNDSMISKMAFVTAVLTYLNA
ncbi:MAG TPA: hypothetical protein VHX42_05410 [Candidatus Babeliales bacterium]|jgi:predicted lipid-binding transport protein (Tim44 family)|nr:hypothetical protein [Candidatus Babeliales bacterium]